MGAHAYRWLVMWWALHRVLYLYYPISSSPQSRKIGKSSVSHSASTELVGMKLGNLPEVTGLEVAGWGLSEPRSLGLQRCLIMSIFPVLKSFLIEGRVDSV